MRGKMGGKSMPKSMAKSMANSMARPRLISEAKSRKLLEVVKDVQNLKSVFLGSPISRCVVPYWKMDDLGGVEVAGLAGGWLAGRASLKMLEPKDPIRPRWGVKKRKRFWLPPKRIFCRLVGHLEFQVHQSALRVEGQKHRLFPQSHFVDGIEPRAPKGASAKMCLCMYFHGLACASKQPTSRFQCLKPATEVNQHAAAVG